MERNWSKNCANNVAEILTVLRVSWRERSRDKTKNSLSLDDRGKGVNRVVIPGAERKNGGPMCKTAGNLD